MFYFMVLTTFLFTLNSHPLILSLLLMVVSLVYAMAVAFVSSTSWLAYMLILVFLSGLMIILLYMTSLSSNESIPFNWAATLSAFVLALPLSISLPADLTKELTKTETSLDKNSFLLIYKTYAKMLSETTLIMILYLLIVLIVAMKIISLKKGPLKMN